MRRAPLALLPGLALASALAGAPAALEVLRDGDLADWRARSFHGETRYRAETLDGRRALRAESAATASGWYREVEVELGRTPWLEWTWRVERLPEGGPERRKAGDDFAVRVYVVFSGGLAFWRTRTLSYVWAAREPAGSDWPNPYTANAHMFALRSGPEGLGGWQRERRDVRADYRRAFGEEPPPVAAVALMSDSDDTGSRTLAWYGDIRFSPE